ncbi:MAG: carboxyl transferase domain-containing protein [Myxococcota bacterium]
MSWQDEVDGIEARLRAALALGGEAAIAAQHAKGRLTVRERIDALVDAGSFQEQGPIAGHADKDAEGRLIGFSPANYLLGVAKLDGRPVVVGGEDFTQAGGSPSPAGLRKSVMAEELAVRLRLPLVRLLEGGGGSVAPRRPGSDAPIVVESANAPPRFLSFAQAMAQAPVVSAALGAVAGLPAARLVASHFSLMARETAQVLIAGPALVERARGVRTTKEELGGARVHLRSGVVDNAADDEREVFQLARRFLSYLPTNVWQRAPVTSCDDPADRAEEELLALVPRERRKSYKMRRALELVLDRGSLLETAPEFGRSLVCGLARLRGQPVGVVANDPNFYAGAMTAESAQKLRRHVDLCDTFHLPIVSFVDEPGFLIGPEAEHAATIRHGTAAIFAVMQSSVPWLSVHVRKAFGVAAAAHFGPGGHVIAWPSAESGALPLEGGVAVAFRREIEAAPDPEAKRRELEEQLAARRDPYARAESFGVADLIDPRRTRQALCAWVEWIQPSLAGLRGPRAYSLRP